MATRPARRPARPARSATAASPPPADKPATRTKSPTVPTVTTLSVNQIDAVLRDPSCPADIRATIAAQHNANEYLKVVTFDGGTGDDDYVTVKHPEPDA